MLPDRFSHDEHSIFLTSFLDQPYYTGCDEDEMELKRGNHFLVLPMFVHCRYDSNNGIVKQL